MARVILEIRYPNTQRPEFRAFDTDRIRIGRGFDNDVIVADEFVSAHHLLLTSGEQGWTVEDCGSANGFLLNGRPSLSQKVSVVSGDQIRIGNMCVRVYDPDHALVPEKILGRNSFFWERMDQKKYVVVSVMVFFLIVYLHSDLWSWHLQTVFKRMAITLFSFLPVVGLAGFWSLIARIVKGRPYFLLNLIVTSGLVSIMLILSHVYGVLAYLICDVTIEFFLYWLYVVTLGAIFLSVYLSVATNISRRHRMVFVVTSSIFLLTVMFSFYFVSVDDFKRDSAPSATLKPPGITIRRPIGRDAFFKKCERVFDSAQSCARSH